MEITPRRTRLIRTSGVRSFRETIIRLARDGAPIDARDRLVVVPTWAAAALLTASIEQDLARTGGALLLPDFMVPRELVTAFASRLPITDLVLTAPEREVLLGVACRTVRERGIEPPFRLRPALLAEMLRFYDTLRWNGRDLDTFERLALGRLAPGADSDRGAERLVRQTRFLVAAFREFETRCVAAGADEHRLRARVLAEPANRPVRHAVVAVGDRAFDTHGLYAADWDLLSRVPGLTQLDVVVTDAALAGAPHERMHAVLPGAGEIRVESAVSVQPALLVGTGDARVHVARDREEEVAGFARRVKRECRHHRLALERAALVVSQPLPYVYVARAVLEDARIPWQMLDSLPLAGEPYAAALDVVCTAVSSSFSRQSSVALLRCPHFDFSPRMVRAFESTVTSREGCHGVSAEDVWALDRALSEAGYLGELESLERLVNAWRETHSTAPVSRAIRAGELLLSIAGELKPLSAPAPPAGHLATLLAFVIEHGRTPEPQDPLAGRERRGRAAVLGVLQSLREAHERFDTEPVSFDTIAPLVRRWIEGQTFAPRAGQGGVHMVDADSARFGDFDLVQLAGVVDGEWPERPRRNIFYSPDILRDLGWPADAERRDSARARFVELLRLPGRQLVVSAFALEADAPVSLSALLDELAAANLDVVADVAPRARIFAYEALGSDPPVLDHLDPAARHWADMRQARAEAPRRPPGFTGSHAAAAWPVSALERYQDCPFKFFASHVLRLEEDPDDGTTVSPRARGRLVHEVLQRFFERWDALAGGAITPVRLEEARAVFAEAAEPLLSRLPEPDASLERTRLFGSGVAMGAMDILLGLEASLSGAAIDRWLECRLEGRFPAGAGEKEVLLRGVADRVDLLPGRRLRVIDYKTGALPIAARALQVPIYAAVARDRLQRRDGAPWAVHEAAYIRLAETRAWVPIVQPGDEGGNEVIAAARGRAEAVLQGITRGEFPPRPFDPALCVTCAFAAVCRKEYVDRA